MPAWIHDRAAHIRARNPSMPESESWAIATQQSHALGKSPKGYGTSEGRAKAKRKYDTPADDQKTAAIVWAAFADELLKVAGTEPREQKKNKPFEVAKAVLLPPAAFAVGSLAAFGAGQLADTIHKKVRGTPLPSSSRWLPPLAAAAGTAFALSQAQKLKDIRRALKDEPDRLPGSAER